MFRILLVDDNPNYRSILNSTLYRCFTEIEIKEAGADSDATAEVNSFKPDLVFMDLHLGDNVNGLELISIIKAEHPQLEITVLSNHDTQEYRTAARQIGADFYFSKKAALKSILDYVSSAINCKQDLHAGII